MTSLAETYGARGSRARKRLLAGTSLFVAGALLVVVGIVVASTGVLSLVGIGTFGAREIAGVVAGLGVPAVFVGVFTVLPASRKERAAAAIGSLVAILGVVLFSYAYPARWANAYGSSGNELTFAVLVIYFVGALTTFWSLFTAIVNVKARNPGGTVTLQRIIRQATGSSGVSSPGSKPSGSGTGSVGIAGDLGGSGESTAAETGAASDGGTDAEVLRTPEPSSDGPDSFDPSATRDERSQPGTDPDAYCGNCTHFEYVRAESGMQPYCGYHDELMDDMEACEQWQANTGSGRLDRAGD